jgi:hypothetical protein
MSVAVHLLVLGDRRGSAWVIRESRTAFARERVREVKRAAPGEGLVLYASSSAFGRGSSGLFGTATITRGVEYLDQPFRLNFKEFHADLPFRFETLTPFRNFVELGPLVDDLELFAGNREKWGVYLRRPLIALSANDARTLTQALAPRTRPASEVLQEYLSGIE